MGTIGVGQPATILLNQFGRILFDAFGTVPYQVGSSLKTTQWRDVDVRIILDDEIFHVMFGPPVRPQMMNKKWAAYCLAFSLLGKQMTGLPIDFQIQQMTQANEEFRVRDDNGEHWHSRSALLFNIPWAGTNEQ